MFARRVGLYGGGIKDLISLGRVHYSSLDADAGRGGGKVA